jgi:hypothetical protein
MEYEGKVLVWLVGLAIAMLVIVIVVSTWSETTKFTVCVNSGKEMIEGSCVYRGVNQ